MSTCTHKDNWDGQDKYCTEPAVAKGLCSKHLRLDTAELLEYAKKEHLTHPTVCSCILCIYRRVEQSFQVDEVSRKVAEELQRREIRRLADQAERSSGVNHLAPVDLSDVLNPNYVEPQPTVLCLEDGEVCLFEQGRTHSINGETGSGKTWLAILGGAQQLKQGEHVVYIDCEDNAGSTVSRLLAMGVERLAIAELFTYIRPHGPWSDEQVEELANWLADKQAPLLILDGVTDALTLHGLNSNSDTDVAELFSKFGSRLAAAGPAVVFIDHVSKEGGASGTATSARGSGFKIGGLSGTAIFVDGDAAMGRGVIGQSHVSIGSKVRGGWLQQHTVPGVSAGKRRIALLVVDAAGDTTTVTLEKPEAYIARGADGADFREAQMEDDILALWDDSDEPLTKGIIRAAVPGKDDKISKAVDRMTHDGLLVMVGTKWRRA